jgi:TDG/mug DNA glycosylase family protein
VDEVTPNEIARTLGVTGLTFRNWLRSEKVAGHPLLAGHEYRTRYRFTRREADQLATEYRASGGRPRAPAQPYRGTAKGKEAPAYASPSRQARQKPASRRSTSSSNAQPGDPHVPDDAMAGLVLSDEPGHRLTETWMGCETLTLADLLRPGLRAVVVGINPSPVSVAAGHYYQGQLGQRFFQRLDEAGVINLPAAGFQDDAAYAAGIGFTDVVKRPTRRAMGLHPGELEHGRELLDRKLSRLTVPKVLFTFKGSAEALLGPLARPGLQTHTISGAEVFVMPGPMAAGAITERVLGELRDWWRM